MDFDPDFDPEAGEVVWTKNEAEEEKKLDPYWEDRQDVFVCVDEGLSSLPSSFSNFAFLSHIRILYLFNNFITEIPSSISSLSNLREFDISHNRISFIHEDISLLSHLELLNITDNKLPSFPLVITRIPSLQTLQISSNNLTSIPPEISLLSNLTSLELRYNKIDKLPDTIPQMTNLTNLNLFNNSLSEFPEMFLQMTGLLNLELRNNPIPHVIPNISSYLPTARVAASVPHKVLDGFFIGDWATATNIESLKRSNITHILTVMNSMEPYPFPEQFTYRKFHVRDDDDEDLASIFSQCHEFIEEGRKNSGGVLVHCAAGISRSATIVLSYLMKTRKSSFDVELAYLRSVRSIVDPNPGFVRQLKMYEKQFQ